MSGKITTFLKEVKLEVKKVNWPSKNQTVNYTLIVLGISFGVAAFLGSLDFVFTWILEKFII
jgi:preprotein translocase subunit SecE